MRKNQVIARGTTDPDAATLDSMLDRGERVLSDQLRTGRTFRTFTEQWSPSLEFLRLRCAPPRGDYVAALRAPSGLGSKDPTLVNTSP